jgi:hypothetical protein
MKDVRETEAEWLRDEMNKAGHSNQALFLELTRQGWTGTVNNLSNWRNGLAPIPDEVVPLLVRAFDRDPEKEGLADVVGFLARRYSWLKPYLKTLDAIPAARTESTRGARQEPVYYGKRGNFQGQRFVLYQDMAGNYVAGRTRFEDDKQLFSRKDDLVRALKADPELRVRMVPENVKGAPPSLIHQRSLVWESPQS